MKNMTELELTSNLKKFWGNLTIAFFLYVFSYMFIFIIDGFIFHSAETYYVSGITINFLAVFIFWIAILIDIAALFGTAIYFFKSFLLFDLLINHFVLIFTKYTFSNKIHQTMVKFVKFME